MTDDKPVKSYSTPDVRDEIRKKWDRHPAYIYIHIGLSMVALGIMLTPLVRTSSPITFLSPHTQQLLASCMFAGAMIALAGSLMGTRFLLHDTEAKPLDLRYPFICGAAGLFAMGISLFVYFLVILAYSDVVGTLGGGLSMMLCIFAIHMGILYVRQLVQLSTRRKEAIRVLVSEELSAEQQLSDDI